MEKPVEELTDITTTPKSTKKKQELHQLNRRNKKCKKSIDRVEEIIKDVSYIAITTLILNDDEFEQFGKYITSSLKNHPSVNVLQ